MKLTLTLFIVALSFGAICGEEKENVICKKCNCDAKTKTIECSNLGLEKMFTTEEWAVVNATDNVYEILKFDHNLLENIDVPFPALKFPVKIVNFRHNKINQITKKAFGDLKYLEEIDLSFNKLTSDKLKPEVFEGPYNPDEYEPLISLKILRLSYNELHTLDSMIFEHTEHLKELYLDHNPFQIVHTSVLQAFNDIPQLHKLDMSDMELDSLPRETFHPLRALKVLNLDGNLFKTIPEALKYAINVEELSLSMNPLLDLSEDNSFPVMKKLEKLNITFVPTMKRIEKAGMAGLESLEELRLSHNHNLSYIDPDAFTFIQKDDPSLKQWPIIKRLYLDNNNLSSLDSMTFSSWKTMEEVHIHDNPWLCDCNLQFVNKILMPIIRKTTPHLIEHIKCSEPRPLAGQTLLELSDQHSEFRCLDKYGSHPERDSALLVALVIGVLLGMPLAFASIMIYKRGCGRQRGAAHYSRAFYKRADTHSDDVNI